MWWDGDMEEWGLENVCVVQGVQDNGIDFLIVEFICCLDFIGKLLLSFVEQLFVLILICWQNVVVVMEL